MNDGERDISRLDISRLLGELASASPTEAWSEFLEDYAPVLQQVVHLFETETDAAADCFLFICEHLASDQFRRLRKFRPGGPASFPTWLRAVARNLCVDWHRKTRGRLRDGTYPDRPVSEPLEDHWFTDPHPDPEMRAASQQRESSLRRMVAGLPDPERLLIRLRFEQDLTLDQIAKLTGLKDAQTVDRRVRQILDSMRESLRERGKFRERSV
jgi:RNA polymerase sigma factor (sigma-70 family)